MLGGGFDDVVSVAEVLVEGDPRNIGHPADVGDFEVRWPGGDQTLPASVEDRDARRDARGRQRERAVVIGHRITLGQRPN